MCEGDGLVLRSWRVGLVPILTLLASTAFAGLSDCRLEAVDAVAHTAVIRCNDKVVLLERGKVFQGFSVIEVTAEQVTLLGSDGETFIWHSAKQSQPSYIQRISSREPESKDNNSDLWVAPAVHQKPHDK